MQDHSVFIADCLCGTPFETRLRYYICPACGRHIILEWGKDAPTEGENIDSIQCSPEALT
jgi:hypothetical protein